MSEEETYVLHPGIVERGRIKARGERLLSPDYKELAEREEAAQAYSQEDERHFVDYALDAINHSLKANESIRQAQHDLYRVYQEEEPAFYQAKESWQSRVVVPKPFNTVLFGASTVRKAFSPDFLSIADESNTAAEAFWRPLMTRCLSAARAKFVTRFTDASMMALAVGISMEMIPVWAPGRGLGFELVEPWKIVRDPDAAPRDPWGGLFWVHREWIDRHVLLQEQARGRYFNVEASWNVETKAADGNDPFLSMDAVRARKEQVWDRSVFRKMIQVDEYWGQVLSPSGELLLENATYTIAGGRLISEVTASPYATMRWPGVSFSPLPHLLRYGGRGFLQGIQSVWMSMNNLMCLHEDALKWAINPTKEVNIDALDDPADINEWPGKTYPTRETSNGQQAVRVTRRPDVTGAVLANMQHYSGLFAEGSLVPDVVRGLPGLRKEVTAREASQSLDQSVAPYSMVGQNFEEGAGNCIIAGYETLLAFADYEDLAEIMGEDFLTEAGVTPRPHSKGQNPEDPHKPDGMPILSGSFHVSGMGSLMRDQETLQTLLTVVVPLAGNPRFAPFIRPGQVLKSIEVRTNLTDEDIFVPPETAEEIDKAQLITILAPLANAAAAAAAGGDPAAAAGGDPAAANMEDGNAQR